MDELQELYRQVILDHNRNPRNFGELEDATRVVAGVNPLCGDKMTLYVKLADGRIEDIRFQGTGCAISVASSSLMTERVKGLPVDLALRLFDKVHELLTAPDDREPPEDLDKLAALGGVREYPSRVKCASLGWHALRSAVADDTTSNTAATAPSNSRLRARRFGVQGRLISHLLAARRRRASCQRQSSRTACRPARSSWDRR